MHLLLIFLQSPGPDHPLFRSEKSWALLVVMLIVFGGALVLLLRQERRLGKLERQWREQDSGSNEHR
jgi:hypothetical protein